MKIEPRSVAFDIDGVVADTMGLFLEIARQQYGINHLRYEDITCYRLSDCLDMDPVVMEQILVQLIEGTYGATLRPIPDAPEVLNRLGRAHGPIVFVTARPHPGPLGDWLQNALNLHASQMEIVATGSHEAKSLELQLREVSVFVEDRLETCYHIQQSGIAPILFRQPWNRQRHPFSEVATWRELEMMLDL